MRRPFCSATCSGGIWPTSAASTRCCPAAHGFARKVKPLVRLSERETAAYCVLQGIDYIVDECPMSVGNRHLGYKEALNEIEARSPGSKAAFYFGFLERVSPLVARPPRKKRRACTAARVADHPPSARSALSASWWSGPAVTYEPPFPGGGEDSSLRCQGPALSGNPRSREGEFHTHSGPVDHDQVLGRDEGVVVRSTRGARYTAVRPTLAEVVLKMPRGAQVIYPKDLGPILMMGDIFPGARVLESGLGSGALSMALLRAGADVTGYEIRPDFAARAQANVAGFLGADALERYHGPGPGHIRRASRSPVSTGWCWTCRSPGGWSRTAESVLRPGGILVSYLPTIGQVSTLRAAIDKSGFGMAETIEVLQRSWHIEGQSVRPDHRMVAHTGFLTSARLLIDTRTEAAASEGIRGKKDGDQPGPDED